MKSSLGVSAAVTETVIKESVKPVRFSNLVLKRWLHCVGGVRRYNLLRKLKTQLQNYGLTQKQVQRGLIQLVTQSRVVLTREPITKKCRIRQLSINYNEEKSSEFAISYKTDTAVLQCQLQPVLEYVQKLNAMKIDTDNKNKQTEKVESMKSCKTELINSQESFVKSGNSKSEVTLQSELHSPEKISKQLDVINSIKANINHKSKNKNSSLIVPTDTTSKLENYSNNKKSAFSKESNKIKNLVINNKNDVNCVWHETLGSLFDESDQSLNNLTIQDKRNCAIIDLVSCYNEQDTNFTKFNINKKLETVEEDTNTKTDTVPVETKHFVEENDENKIILNTIQKKKDCTRYSDIKTGNAQVYLHKKRSYGAVCIDSLQKRKKVYELINKPKVIDRSKKKKLKEFRKYFGECLSTSEDEQEQNILQKSFKRRKKKDFVDSCDSEVYINERNAAINFEKNLRDIQTTVPDSTIPEECIQDTSTKSSIEIDVINVLPKENYRNEAVESTDQSENVTNTVEFESNKLDSAYEVSNIQLNENKINTEIVNTNNVVQSIITEETTCFSSKKMEKNLERSGATNVSTTKIEMSVSLLSCNASELKSEEFNAEIVETIDLLDFQKSNPINHNCKITSDENVSNIPEDVMKDINENTVHQEDINLSANKDSASKVFTKKEPSNNKDKNSTYLALNEDENSDKVTSSDARKDIKTVLINNTVCNTLDNVNETALQESPLKNITKETNTQSNKVCPVRLRVLSSSELGSRWCPTPIYSLSSDTELSSNNLLEPVTSTTPSSSTLLSETVPTTSAFIATTSVPVSTSSSPETSVLLNNTVKTSLDSKISNTLNHILLKIYNIIRHVRISILNIGSRYDRLLYAEFQRLKNILMSENYTTLIHNVIIILNKSLFGIEPLNLQELFCYTPSLQSLYKTGDSNEHQHHISKHYSNEVPTVMKNTMLHQNILCSPTSTQANFQSLGYMNVMQQHCTSNSNQAPVNIKSKYKQILQEDVVIPQQNSVIQSNATIDSNMNPTLNTTHINYKQKIQKPFKQKNTSHVYRSVSDTNVSQDISGQQQIPTSFVNVNQPGKYMCTSTINTYVNQQCIPHAVYMPEANTFYTAGATCVPNYPVQQNVNPAHITQQQNSNIAYNKQHQNINLTQTIPLQKVNSVHQQLQKTLYSSSAYNITQGISQAQTVSQIPQNAPFVNYIPQSAQKAFGPAICQPILKSAQQNKQMYQQLSSQTQKKAPPNFPPEQKVSSSLHMEKNKKPTIIENRKVCITKATNIEQRSLKSMAKSFSILKYLTNIQKMILLNQLNFYFGCTTWLEQEFSQEEWQRIQYDRTLLLNFHTLLKHTMDKTLQDLQNKYKSNTCRKDLFTDNFKIDTVKEVQTVQDSGVYCQVNIVNTNQVQNKITNSTPQQNLDIPIVQKQSVEVEKIINTSEDTRLTDWPQKTRVLQTNETVEKNDLEVLQRNEYPVCESVLKTKAILKYPENCKNGEEKNLQDITKEQHSDKLEKVPESISYIVEKEASVALSLEKSNTDTLLQLSSHLVTVEISPDSDYVTVTDIIDTHTAANIPKTTKTEIIEGNQQLQGEKLNLLPAKDTTPKVPTVFKSSDINTECSNDENNGNFIIEKNSFTHIADVRSISLEAFETIEAASNKSAIVEGNIEEEEIKVCLYCSKLSTVVCSICLEAKYCSKECSELHWQEHYKTCKPVGKSMYL